MGSRQTGKGLMWGCKEGMIGADKCVESMGSSLDTGAWGRGHPWLQRDGAGVTLGSRLQGAVAALGCPGMPPHHHA